MPIIGILISATQIKYYTIPLALAIALYVYETCQIFKIEMVCPWWTYSYKHEKIMQTLRFFTVSILGLIIATLFLLHTTYIADEIAASLLTAITIGGYLLCFHGTVIKIYIKRAAHQFKTKWHHAKLNLAKIRYSILHFITLHQQMRLEQ